jgi:phosphatidylserine/phosphatidylglycerophosphate/cardiolipin synthase-like enzyme
MGVDTELMMKKWWAEGDIAVHTNSRAAYFVDGRSAMLTFCLHFLKAHKYIYIASWGLSPDLELVRGNDHRAGPDGSPEQDTLVAGLRARGLEQADIDFWCTHELTVQAVLGYALSKGVEVKVLLWCGPELPVLIHDKPREAQRQLLDVGITCILDDSAQGIIHHPFESLHQKISIVDGTHAFVGGIDPVVELSGEFDRWDSPLHLFSSSARRTRVGTSPHPWHDAHALIEGPAARDVEHNFLQRWNNVVERHDQKDLLLPEHPPALPLESKIIMQVARTIPQRTYHFELDAALRRGVTVALVLPDHPNVGRADTDASLAYLRGEAPEAMAEGRLQVFCLGCSTRQEDGEHYRPIYVVIYYGFLLYVSLTKPVSEWRYRWVLIPFQIYAVLNILLIGYSRMLEGSHWLTDALGGYLSGALWLSLIIFLYRWTIDKLTERRARRLQEQSTQAQQA